MSRDNIVPIPKLVDPGEIKPSELLKNQAFVDELRRTVKQWVDTAKPLDIGWIYNQIAYRETRKKARKVRDK